MKKTPLVLDELDVGILKVYQNNPRRGNYVASLKVSPSTAYTRLRARHKKGFCKPVVNIAWDYFGLRNNWFEAELGRGREKETLEELENYKGLQFYSVGQSGVDVVWAALLDAPSSPAEPFFDEMRNEGLIEDYRFYRTGCHFKTQTDFSRYSPRTKKWNLGLPEPRCDCEKGEWVLDSEELKERIEEEIKGRPKELYPAFDEPREFDVRDLFIISELSAKPEITYDAISKKMKTTSKKMGMTSQAVFYRANKKFSGFRPDENGVIISYAIVSPLTFIYQHRKIHVLEIPDYHKLNQLVFGTIELPFVTEVSAVLNRPELILQTVLPEDTNPFLGLPKSIISAQRTTSLDTAISRSLDVRLEKCFDEETGKWSFY